MNDRSNAAPQSALESCETVRFATYELNRTTGELRKGGIRLKLAEQPFRILAALLERPGELVTRDDLVRRVWPENTFGDLEQGLNRAVSKLRDVLGDSASNPRFIETLPGRGYRFILPVLEGPATQAAESAPPQSRGRRHKLGYVALALLAVTVLTHFWLMARKPLLEARWRKLTSDNFRKSAPALSDGSRVYFLASFLGERFLAQAPASGGQPVRLPIHLPGTPVSLHDLSPDWQELLISTAPAPSRTRDLPLWAVSIADGSVKRIGEISAASAAYSPTGERIAFSTEGELWTAGKSGDGRQRLISSDGSAIDAVMWSSDGTRISFARRHQAAGHISAWEVRVDGSELRRIAPSWTEQHSPAGAAGGLDVLWSDGKFWAMRARSFFGSPMPVPLTLDGPEFDAPVRIRRGDGFHAVGVDRLGELQRYDLPTRSWLPVFDGVSAESAEYSRDGKRVAYVMYPEQSLWVRDADGRQPTRLTDARFVASFPRWSPDGRQILFTGQRAPDQPRALYVVDSRGGKPKLAFAPATEAPGYPSWSPDGQQLLYSVLNADDRIAAYIRVVDVRTGAVTKFPGSDGLFGPRWAPNGSRLAATSDRHTLKIYDTATKRWEDIASDGRWPAWTLDSRAIVYTDGDALLQYAVETGEVRRLTNLNVDELGGRTRSLTVAADGSPLRTLNRDSRQLYEIKLPAR